MKYKKLKFSMALVAAVAFSAFALPSTASAKGINIGVLTPLTSTNAVQGQDILNGIKLAVHRINQGYEVPMQDGSKKKVGPGLLGGKINLTVEDSESRPQSAMAAVHKLIDVDHVPIILGTYASGVTIPTGQYANDQKTVDISAGATSPKLREIGPYFFDVMGLDHLMGQAMGEFAVKDSGAEKIASLVANNPFGVGMEIQGCIKVEDMGSECVTKVRYRQGKSDYRADLQRVVSKDPGAAFFVAYGTDANLILKQAYELGISPNWYAAYPTLWTNEIADNPQVGEGIKGLRVGEADDFYETEYAKPYEEAFDMPPSTTFGGYAYDSAMLAALAIKKAGNATADGIKDALGPVSKTYKGATGNKEFDEDGMQVEERYAPVIFKDGKLQLYEQD